MKTAVVYTSKVGNTAKVAKRIAEAIDADLFKLGQDEFDVKAYDRFILGTGVYAGKISKAMNEFITKNDLGNVSLFVTCMYNDEKGAKQLEKIANKYGISDAIFFNKVDFKTDSPDSKLADYIKTL